MEGNYQSSWADQWDDDSSPTAETKKKDTATSKYKQKIGEGFDKTKGVASTGTKKVKQGTSLGIKWIKDKYEKITHKH